MKPDFPISDYYRRFFDDKADCRVHLVIDGIPFFADFDAFCFFSSEEENSVICAFSIDCEVNTLNET